MFLFLFLKIPEINNIIPITSNSTAYEDPIMMVGVSSLVTFGEWLLKSITKPKSQKNSPFPYLLKKKDIGRNITRIDRIPAININIQSYLRKFSINPPLFLQTCNLLSI